MSIPRLSKRGVWLGLILLCSLTNSSLGDERAAGIPSFLGYVPNEFVVVLKDDFVASFGSDLPPGQEIFKGQPGLNKLMGKFQVNQVERQFRRAQSNSPMAAERRMARHFKVRFRNGTLAQAMNAYRLDPSVERVEPIGIHSVQREPNDPYYTSPPPEFPYDQWHYWSADGIEADRAWDSETGDSDVVVGILDSGVRYFHRDLGGNNPVWSPDSPPLNQGNIWVNHGEIAANGVDDDGNGYIDDTIGWDFVSRADSFPRCIDQDCRKADNDPDDGDGHGTHVAGTVAAITNNNQMVAGVAGGWGESEPGVQIMSLRIGYRASYLGQEVGLVRMDWAAEAMYYVAQQVDRGVNVAAINCSWGSSDSGGLGAAVDHLISRDVVVVVAAGNSNSTSPDYLGSRGDCLDVAATDSGGVGASFTNSGQWVDVAAPGVNILSTYAYPGDPDLNNHYIALLSGTSMAAPHVTGIVALLESADASLSASQKRSRVISSTNPYSDFRELGTGIASAYLALSDLGPADKLPTVSIVDPAEGQVVSGTYRVFVIAEDDKGIEQVQISVDGDPHQDITHNFDGGRYFFDWATTGDGPHSLQARATDSALQSTESDTVNVTAENVNDSPTASFIFECSGLTCNFDASSSHDPENGPMEYAWAFGDGNYEAGVTSSHTYSSSGTYTVLLTVTDNGGLTGEVTHSVTVDNLTVKMFISSLVMSGKKAGKNLSARASVTIIDTETNLVEGATVYGTWSGDYTGSVSGVTGADGTVTFSSGKVRASTASFSFTVERVVATGKEYDPGLNLVDSTGTVTVP